MQDPQQLLQAVIQGQMGMRPMGVNNGMHPMHTEATLGSSGPSATVSSNDVRGGSKLDVPDARASGADGQGNSAAGHSSGDGAEDAK